MGFSVTHLCGDMEGVNLQPENLGNGGATGGRAVVGRGLEWRDHLPGSESEVCSGDTCLEELSCWQQVVGLKLTGCDLGQKQVEESFDSRHS